MRALRDLVLVSRPLSWINTAYPFAAAWLMAGGGIDATLIVGTLFFLIPYNLAMYGINDVFDYESDLRNPRKGGVEGAVVDRSRHRLILWAAVLTCVPFVIYLFAVGTLASHVVLAVSLFAVTAYSVKGLRFKEVPFLDSVTSSTHFSSPAWFAVALLGTQLSTGWLMALMAFFVWGIASQAFGAVQDIAADRAAGLGSIATVLGARPTVILSTSLYLLVALAMLLTTWPAPLLSIAALAYVISTARFLSITDDTCEQAHAGWRSFLWLNYVAGFAVTLVLLSTASWWPLQ